MGSEYRYSHFKIQYNFAEVLQYNYCDLQCIFTPLVQKKCNIPLWKIVMNKLKYSSSKKFTWMNVFFSTNENSLLHCTLIGGHDGNVQFCSSEGDPVWSYKYTDRYSRFIVSLWICLTGGSHKFWRSIGTVFIFLFPLQSPSQPPCMACAPWWQQALFQSGPAHRYCSDGWVCRPGSERKYN